MPSEQIIGTAIHTACELSSMVQAEMQKHSEEHQSLEALRSSLDALRARHQLHKSYITQLSDWYGAQSFLERGKYFLFVAACSVLVGAALASAIETAIAVSASLFFLVSYIIDDHAANTTYRDSVFADDILRLEAVLNASIVAMNEHDKKMKDLFAELFSHNLKVIEHLKQLDADNIYLKEQTERFVVEINQFEQMTKKFIADNARLLDERGKTNVDLAVIQQSFDSMQKSYAFYIEQLQALAEKGSHESQDALGAALGDELLARYSRRVRPQKTASSADDAGPFYNARLNFLGPKTHRAGESQENGAIALLQLGLC